MMTVEKISAIKSAGSYLYNGAVIEATDVLESGRIICTVTLADGTTFEARNRPSSLKYRIEHGGEQRDKTTKAVIPCGHADHSACHGEHVTKAVPSNKLAKQHRKLMLALHDIQSILWDNSDDIAKLVHSRWFKKAEDARRIEAEAEAKKAAIEAKKQAEAEAKKQQELINTVVSDLHALSKYMTQEQAVVMLSNKYGADVVQSVVFGMV